MLVPGRRSVTVRIRSVWGERMNRISRRAFTAAALSALVTAGDAAAVPVGDWADGTNADGTDVDGPDADGPDAEDAGGGGVRAGQGEMRGMWLATVAGRDWPSSPDLDADRQRTELLACLDAAVDRKLNTVFFQVRAEADALWPSRYEPWSRVLTGTQGQDPGWDPLGTAVKEAHDRGLALHAWFNPYRIANHADPRRLAATHPAREHPDWVVTYGGKLYYNPGLPEVRSFVENAMLDAVERYAVDGVHWDDYFYPYPVSGATFDDDDAFAAHGGGYAGRASWRRNNIDTLVRETAARIKEIRPAALFGISPFGVWRNASTDPRGSDTRGGVQTYDDLYADTRKWVREGWIDYVVPQVYWEIGNSAADYATLVPWWARTVRGTSTRLYIGEALYKAPDWPGGELSDHLTLAARQPEVHGHVYFAAKEVATDPGGAMARVVTDHYRQPAAPPR